MSMDAPDDFAKLARRIVDALLLDDRFESLVKRVSLTTLLQVDENRPIEPVALFLRGCRARGIRLEADMKDIKDRPMLAVHPRELLTPELEKLRRRYYDEIVDYLIRQRGRT